MSTFAFTVRDASGEAHDYEGTLHPTSEGAPIVFALGAILGPMIGRALGALLVDGLPLVEAKIEIEREIERMIEAGSIDGAISVVEEVGARLLPKVQPSTLAPIPEKIGDAIGRALSDPRCAPIVLEVFRHTRRDGRALVFRDAKKNVLRTEGYDLAFRGNYGEMISAFVQIAGANRFFGVWGTSPGEPTTPSDDPSPPSGESEDE